MHYDTYKQMLATFQANLVVSDPTQVRIPDREKYFYLFQMLFVCYLAHGKQYLHTFRTTPFCPYHSVSQLFGPKGLAKHICLFIKKKHLVSKMFLFSFVKKISTESFNKNEQKLFLTYFCECAKSCSSNTQHRGLYILHRGQ